LQLCHAGLDASRLVVEKECPMFTRIGLPQLGLIVVILIVFLIYTQRHRF
jgi:hypothetical protein